MCLTHTLLCAYRRCNNFNQFSLNYFFKNHTPKCVNRSKIYKWLLMLLKLKDLLQLPTIQPSSWYIYRVSPFNWVPFLKPQSSVVGHENILFLYVIILNFQLKGSTYLPRHPTISKQTEFLKKYRAESTTIPKSLMSKTVVLQPRLFFFVFLPFCFGELLKSTSSSTKALVPTSHHIVCEKIFLSMIQLTCSFSVLSYAKSYPSKLKKHN